MTVAPWSKRAFAWLVDMHVSMIALVVAYVVSEWGFTHYDGAVAWTISITSYVLWWMVGFMNRCVRMGRTGQSWGRALLDISLVREVDGKPIGIWRAFIRENTHFVDYFSLGYGWLRPLKDPKGQTIADLFNKAITVYGQPPLKPVVLGETADVSPVPAVEQVRPTPEPAV